MELDDIILGIEAEWVPEAGFFWRLRAGVFDPGGFARVLGKLAAVPVVPGKALPSRLSAMLWHAPAYMQQQAASIRMEDLCDFEKAIERLALEIERIWVSAGIPPPPLD